MDLFIPIIIITVIFILLSLLPELLRANSSWKIFIPYIKSSGSVRRGLGGSRLGVSPSWTTRTPAASHLHNDDTRAGLAGIQTVASFHPHSPSSLSKATSTQTIRVNTRDTQETLKHICKRYTQINVHLKHLNTHMYTSLRLPHTHTHTCGVGRRIYRHNLPERPHECLCIKPTERYFSGDLLY